MPNGHEVGLVDSVARLNRWAPAILIGLIFAVIPTFAQTAEKCPLKAPLTLSQVLAKADKRGDDGETASLIRTCDIGFTLSIATLDRLSGIRVSSELMDALDQDDTYPETSEQARKEVAVIEKYLSDIWNGSVAGRGSALRKLDTEYLAKKAQAERAIPKGEFEKTPENEEVVRQSKAILDAIDKNHETGVFQYSQLFYQRIFYLKQRPYQIAGEAVYQGYDTDLGAT